MTNGSNSTKNPKSLPTTDDDTASSIGIRKQTLVIYILAFAVVSCATIEWLGQYGYSQTTKRLRRLSEDRLKVVTLTMARRETAGFPVIHTVKVNDQTGVLLWWPSFFKSREVVLQVKVKPEQTVVTRFNIPSSEPSETYGATLAPQT